MSLNIYSDGSFLQEKAMETKKRLEKKNLMI